MTSDEIAERIGGGIMGNKRLRQSDVEFCRRLAEVVRELYEEERVSERELEFIINAS